LLFVAPTDCWRGIAEAGRPGRDGVAAADEGWRDAAASEARATAGIWRPGVGLGVVLVVAAGVVWVEVGAAVDARFGVDARRATRGTVTGREGVVVLLLLADDPTAAAAVGVRAGEGWVALVVVVRFVALRTGRAGVVFDAARMVLGVVTVVTGAGVDASGLVGVPVTVAAVGTPPGGLVADETPETRGLATRGGVAKGFPLEEAEEAAVAEAREAVVVVLPALREGVEVVRVAVCLCVAAEP